MTEQNSQSLPHAQNPVDFVNWFRDSSPYIHNHKDNTFVIYFGGEAVQDAQFEKHVHDIALLSSLGIRLILVHGIRPQIDTRLHARGKSGNFKQQIRITDDIALQCVQEAAGTVRVELEALLSMGLANSPMSGAKIRVISGNFVTAKPLGVIQGVDFMHTGAVRRVDRDAIFTQLQHNHVVLVSPVGYSPSGQMYNLAAEQLSTQIAIAVQAEKLILLTESSCTFPENQQLIAQMTTPEALQHITSHPHLPIHVLQPLKAAIKASQGGVNRVHLINRQIDGGLLLELFSRNGIGTLVSANSFEELRTAELNDIAGILELTKPLEQQGILIKRSRESLEIDISDYTIIERDGLIIGCSALHTQDTYAVIACLAIHQDYRNAERGSCLLEHMENQAHNMGLESLYVLSTQTMAWFQEHGFHSSDLTALPEAIKAQYNHQRNSKILCKNIV